MHPLMCYVIKKERKKEADDQRTQLYTTG